MSEILISDPKLTEHGHVHGEAFCLMWYACKQCGHRERFWNSRDGVTPFAMGCPSCSSYEMQHWHINQDEYAPNHKLHHGQRFWRDGTPDEAEAIMRRRIVLGRGKYPLSVAREKMLIAMARDPDAPDGEFRRGWPILDTYDALKAQP